MVTQPIDTSFILTVLRELAPRLRQDFSINQIGLYGSFARNEQTAQSDIDLIYHLDENRFLTLPERERLSRLLRRKLGRRLDLVNEKIMNPFVKYAMQKDVIYVRQ